MLIIKDKITIDELKEMSKKMFGDLVKAVVDIENNIMAIDGELHADEEQLLLANGSIQANLWGINIYPEMAGSDDFVEFDSMINIRPRAGNRSRGVEDPITREKILKIIDRIITK
jgi:hypothetical protein